LILALSGGAGWYSAASIIEHTPRYFLALAVAFVVVLAFAFERV
jgi:hypothetical protein